MRRSIAATLAMAAAFDLLGPVPVTAAPAAAVSYPAPAPLPPVDAGTLPERYQATARAVAAGREVAEAAGDADRARALAALRGRDLLEFDPRANGRAVEVVGDLPRADRIAVIVPGSDTTLDTFSDRRGPGGGAHALHREIGTVDPDSRVAVVAWLGYDPPQGVSYRVATDHLARAGEAALRDTVATLTDINSTASVSLLCHSYGSVVCAYAAPGLPVADLAVYGSPGVGSTSADRLDTAARVWAGRADGDWIRFVPSVRVGRLGFGTDPVDASFGARIFDAGAGGHGDYHLAGTVALRNLALIALGAGAPGRAGVVAVRHG